MKKAMVVGGTFAVVLVLLVLAVRHRVPPGGIDSGVDTGLAPRPAAPRPAAHRPAIAPGFIHGRVTLTDGNVYEGRLRWGGNQEAFWSDYFNGFKDVNPWRDHVPPEQLEARRPIEIFGLEIGQRTVQIDLGRPFMARFGDIARIETRDRDIRVTLKSGTVIDLDRFASDDLADGLRVWDADHGVVDLGERQIRGIDLFPSARLGTAPERLYGSVRTGQGTFTGFVQWNRALGVGTDTLTGERTGESADGQISLPFDTIRSIARHDPDGSRVTRIDGREIVLRGHRDVGTGNRGLFVDDPRYGRVLVSWDAFERVDFRTAVGDSGPAYDHFPPGRPLHGIVTTRAGRRLAGRLIYDLDESETTETLDAPFKDVSYTIPFGLIDSIVPAGDEAEGGQPARLTLRSGEVLMLERAGDLGEGNAGMLVFVNERAHPEYVPWRDVQRVDLDRPPAISDS